MKKENSINKKMVARAMIQKIEQERDPVEIKTNFVVGYQSPERIAIKGKTDGYEPDIEVQYNKEMHLYAIELDDSMNTNKWRLMSLYAKKNNGNLHLIVPDWLKQPVRDNLDKEEINAGLIFFNTAE
ncbi:MAG: hypothetical protein GVY19_02255 [Bacteroidetes bacterium]|jgi:hypothetical protein|nr:hypothetical protein [Bacteroidota bacterium]